VFCARIREFNLKLLLAGLLALISISCKALSTDHQESQDQTQESRSIENSGKKISGEFVLKGIESDYGAKGVRAAPETIFKFETDGSFKRERASGGTVQTIDEGSYVISTRNELALYVEKVGAEMVDAARAEYYTINSQTDDTIRLGRGPAEVLILKRR